MESGLTVRAGSPPRYTPPRRIVLDRYRSSYWSVSEGVSLGKKGISSVAVPSTFLTIAELFKGAAEFFLPVHMRGRALLKLLVLGTMVFLVGYSPSQAVRFRFNFMLRCD